MKQKKKRIGLFCLIEGIINKKRFRRNNKKPPINIPLDCENFFLKDILKYFYIINKKDNSIEKL